MFLFILLLPSLLRCEINNAKEHSNVDLPFLRCASLFRRVYLLFLQNISASQASFDDRHIVVRDKQYQSSKKLDRRHDNPIHQ